jgi:hypothetical protein
MRLRIAIFSPAARSPAAVEDDYILNAITCILRERSFAAAT